MPTLDWGDLPSHMLLSGIEPGTAIIMVGDKEYLVMICENEILPLKYMYVLRHIRIT